jgi:hypothetical protein
LSKISHIAKTYILLTIYAKTMPNS